MNLGDSRIERAPALRKDTGKSVIARDEVTKRSFRHPVVYKFTNSLTTGDFSIKFLYILVLSLT
jgi:hypothetical protein